VASVKALEYAVLRLAHALPDSGSGSREAVADVRRALGVEDDAAHADAVSADALDKVAGKSDDKSGDTNGDDGNVSESWTRDRLDDAARERGLNPDDYATKADVVSAVEAHDKGE